MVKLDPLAYEPTEAQIAKRKHPLSKCEVCPLRAQGKYVPPDFNGNETADYVLVGEAPGRMEARKKRPFVGMSGHLVEAVLADIELQRSDTVMTNTVLCQPPNNETPNADAVACCKPALDDVIERAQPKFVVAMGNTAAASVKGEEVKITKERVGPPKQLDDRPYLYLPTVHPAATLRNTGLFPSFTADLQKLKRSLEITFEPPKWKAYDTEQGARAAIAELLQRQGVHVLVLDLEVGQDKDVDFGHPNTLLAAGIAYAPGRAIVLGKRALSHASVREDLTVLLQNKAVVCHNGKYDLGTLYRMGFGKFKLAKDTMFMSYSQNEVRGVHGLKYLARENLGAPDWDAELKPYIDGKLGDPKGGWDNIPLDMLYRYNAYDVHCTWQLMEMFERQMDANDWKVHDFLCWASDEVMVMESEGIFIDVPRLDELDSLLSVTIEDYRRSIVSYIKDNGIASEFDERTTRLVAKKGFNPNSPDQVKAALEIMTRATVTTTDAAMLEALTKHKDPLVRRFADLMLSFRKDAKLYGTYVKGTRERLNPDGRVQTSFLLHGTETGRTSSRNPNVQNVPRNRKDGVNLRSIYAASPGHSLVYADYSNIEGRIVAVLSDSQTMIDQMNSGEKIHNIIAERVFGMGFDKEQYVTAKTVVHGANYARMPQGIADGLGIPLKEAQQLWSFYHGMFPEVKEWHAAVKHQVLHTDDVLMTPWGRKRRFHLITRDNQEDVFKEALAFQPQSIGSDICLTAGIRLRQMGIPCRIFIHDGIVAEPATEDVKECAHTMTEVMEQSAREYTDRLKFPVDIEVGDNWAEVG
jgi:uracil-DNA glycosylase family 4